MKLPFKFLFSLLSLPCFLILSTSAKDQELPAAFAPVEVVLEGLGDPAFLAIDADNVLYVSEEKTGRVLQVFPDGLVQPLIEGLKKPQGVAVDDNVTLYIAAEELEGTKAKGLVLKWKEGQLQIVASGFKKPTGLAVDAQGTVYVADGGAEDEAGGSLFRIDSVG